MNCLARNLRALFWSVMALSVISACAVSEATRQERAARQEQLASAISQGLAERRFQVDVDRAYPQGRGRVIHLTSDYSVRVSGDTIVSYLPFFGRAYSVPYGGGSGLNFTGRITSYSQRVSRSGERIITIGVESKEDVYVYTVSLFDDGNASVGVQPHQRSYIYFTGRYHEEE